MKLEIQQMTSQHVNDCSTLYVNTFSSPPWNETDLSKQDVQRYFLHFLNCNTFLGFVGIMDHEIVAFSAGMKKPWIKGMEYYIDQFCVAYHLQNRGIGSQFWQYIEKQLPSFGIHGVLLNTERSFPSYHFYKKHGFQELEGLVLLGKE